MEDTAFSTTQRETGYVPSTEVHDIYIYIYIQLYYGITEVNTFILKNGGMPCHVRCSEGGLITTFQCKKEGLLILWHLDLLQALTSPFAVSSELLIN